MIDSVSPSSGKCHLYLHRIRNEESEIKKQREHFSFLIVNKVKNSFNPNPRLTTIECFSSFYLNPFKVFFNQILGIPALASTLCFSPEESCTDGVDYVMTVCLNPVKVSKPL